MSSQLDQGQIIQKVYNESNESLNVSVGATINVDTGIVEVAIDQTSDSIRIGDGTNLVTTTNVGGKQGLDVNVINPVAVSGSLGRTWTLSNGIDSVNIGNYPATQPISGNISVISSVLPTGASTEATLANLNNKLVAPAIATIFPSLDVTIGNNITGSFDITNYKNIAFDISPNSGVLAAPVITLQKSMDNINFYDSIVTASGSTLIDNITIIAPYIRFSVSTPQAGAPVTVDIRLTAKV